MGNSAVCFAEVVREVAGERVGIRPATFFGAKIGARSLLNPLGSLERPQQATQKAVESSASKAPLLQLSGRLKRRINHPKKKSLFLPSIAMDRSEEEIDDMGPDDIEPEWEAPLVGRDDVGFGGKDPLAGKYTWERNGALDPLDPAPDLPLEVTETINVGKQQVANTYRS